jgi:hypothetical protein
MDPLFRHQCLIYDGAPSRQLPALAQAMRAKLKENHRCLYLNSPPMVAGMRSYLAAAGVDLGEEMAKGSLILSAEQDHLVDGRFDVATMLQMLGDLVQKALDDGFTALWATGDMTWEMGGHPDFGQLLEYEWRLEEFMQQHPAMCGICQYHADMLPRAALRNGLSSHPAIFVNETLSKINPHYWPVRGMGPTSDRTAALDGALQPYYGTGGRG